MFFAVSTTTLDAALNSGVLTQLEWIDFVDRSLPVDGVVFDIRHCPRTDVEYFAELRKLCIDRGLFVAGLAVDDAFERDAATYSALFDGAVVLGAALIISNPPPSANIPAYAWRDAAARGKALAREAKRTGIPLALRNRAGSLCSSAGELKRLAKDVDSSWLRFCPTTDLRVSSDDLRLTQARTVAISLQTSKSAIPNSANENNVKRVGNTFTLPIAPEVKSIGHAMQARIIIEETADVVAEPSLLAAHLASVRTTFELQAVSPDAKDFSKRASEALA